MVRNFASACPHPGHWQRGSPPQSILMTGSGSRRRATRRIRLHGSHSPYLSAGRTKQ
jgi:hypothetical protein